MGHPRPTSGHLSFSDPMMIRLFLLMLFLPGLATQASQGAAFLKELA